MDNTVNPTEKGMLTMFLFDGMSAETGNAISGFFSQFGLPLILIAALIIMFVLLLKAPHRDYRPFADGHTLISKTLIITKAAGALFLAGRPRQFILLF